MQTSGVHGYAIVPATVRGALRQVRSEREDLDSQLEALLGTMEDLMEATKMRSPAWRNRYRPSNRAMPR